MASHPVMKPWGFYKDFYRDDNVVFKSLKIRKGASISYQKHSKRGEFWFIKEGEVIFKFSTDNNPTQNFSQQLLKKGDTVEILPETWHQLVVPPEIEFVEIWEMQYGNCSEEDIIRVEDKYGRTTIPEEDGNGPESKEV